MRPNSRERYGAEYASRKVRESNQRGSRGINQRVDRGEPGYQLLCANCNWIKRAEMDENLRIYPVAV